MTPANTLPSMDDLLQIVDPILSAIAHRTISLAYGITPHNGANKDWVDGIMGHVLPSDATLTDIGEESMINGVPNITTMWQLLTGEIAQDVMRRVDDTLRTARRQQGTDTTSAPHDVWQQMHDIAEKTLQSRQIGGLNVKLRCGAALLIGLLLDQHGALPAVVHLTRLVATDALPYDSITLQCHLLTALHTALDTHHDLQTPWAWREPLIAQTVLDQVGDPTVPAHARTLTQHFRQHGA